MKTDYPELEGKEVEFVFSDGERVAGIVAGVNYHVGISIVCKDDKEKSLVCINYKLQRKTPFSGPKDYLQAFLGTVRMIKEGTVRNSNIHNFSYTVKCKAYLYKERSLSGISDCPFGQ